MANILDATNSDNIIIGMEVLYPIGCHLEMGRVSSFSAWSGVVEYIIVRPYIGSKDLKYKPEQVTLIDPRPRLTRWRDLFRAR